jgi:hypothetical protein
MVTTVTAVGNVLWIGTQQRNESTSGPGWLMKLDAKSGKILGYVDSSNAHHVVNVTPEQDLLSGARPDQIYWFRAGAKH